MTDKIRPGSSRREAFRPDVKVLRDVIKAIPDSRRRIDPSHGALRFQQRQVKRDEANEVLENGSFTGRVEEKPSWIPKNRTYTLRGEVDGEVLEIVVYFVREGERDASDPLSNVYLYWLTAFSRGRSDSPR